MRVKPAIEMQNETNPISVPLFLLSHSRKEERIPFPSLWFVLRAETKGKTVPGEKKSIKKRWYDALSQNAKRGRSLKAISPALRENETLLEFQVCTVIETAPGIGRTGRRIRQKWRKIVVFKMKPWKSKAQWKQTKIYFAWCDKKMCGGSGKGSFYSFTFNLNWSLSYIAIFEKKQKYK